ncbi:MAG: type II CAAX prenyl endopeptidase Rce1 family protein [Erythrobacter sp.]
MTGEITSARSEGALAPTMRGQWADLLAFLRHPYLPERLLPPGQSARLVARLFALDLVAIAGFAALALTAVGLGLELPENYNATLGLGAQTIVLLVIVAPVLEEIVFRGWLSGRPGTILALFWAGAGLAGLALFGAGAGPAGPIAALIGLVLAAAMLVALRGRPPLPVFERHFAWFFWASAILFAAVHLANYEEGALAILLPLLVPQFVLGTLAGHVRVRCGLVWSMLLHAAHNGFAVGIALVALSLEPAG